MCKNCGCHGLQIEQDIIRLDGLGSGYSQTAVVRAVRSLPGVLAAEVTSGSDSLSVAFDPAKSKRSDVCAAINAAVFAGSSVAPGR